jgi:RNA polymerase sigma-70 factor, ECF subfamily
VALLICRDEPSAHDAVQEGFASALRNLGAFRGDGPLEAWVWRSVVNSALKERRGAIREAREVFVASGDNNGDDGSNRVIRTWIATLPERQRLAVFLRYYADLDYQSIASALGVEVGTISATLNSAHSALRKQGQAVRE